jgi:hypothetical protein
MSKSLSECLFGYQVGHYAYSVCWENPWFVVAQLIFWSLLALIIVLFLIHAFKLTILNDECQKIANPDGLDSLPLYEIEARLNAGNRFLARLPTLAKDAELSTRFKTDFWFPNHRKLRDQIEDAMIRLEVLRKRKISEEANRDNTSPDTIIGYERD